MLDGSAESLDLLHKYFFVSRRGAEAQRRERKERLLQEVYCFPDVYRKFQYELLITETLYYFETFNYYGAFVNLTLRYFAMLNVLTQYCAKKIKFGN
ncbi:hypothetical protein FACHB389_03520 [Nostoc calcicola FACHB-389]|nr:hypothetical protein FACHB389_03520 [Nostoc calcicola FACHB-389]